jgi:hypothetical protein
LDQSASLLGIVVEALLTKPKAFEAHDGILLAIPALFRLYSLAKLRHAIPLAKTYLRPS